MLSVVTDVNTIIFSTLSLPENVWLGCESLPERNTLAYLTRMTVKKNHGIDIFF
jgi:hypothetical protein